MPQETSSIQPQNLTAHALTQPLGLGEPAPVLRWKLPSETLIRKTTAYQIQAASEEAALLAGRADLWDSGWIEAAQIQRARYEGQGLASRATVVWRVRVREDAGSESEWSEPARFELGLLQREDWKGEWIASPVTGGPRTCPPAPYFRKSFQIEQPVQSARLYATALGLFEGELNGGAVSDVVFAPGWTEYSKRVQTLSFDVTHQLQTGENVLGFLLGEGWHTGHVGPRNRQMYGERSALLAQLEIIFADGSRQMIVTDDSWRTSTGPILSNDLIMGEHYDARLELGAWSTPGYDTTDWRSILVQRWPTIELSPSAGPFVRHQETILADLDPEGAPKNSNVWQGAQRLIDLGQNMVGRVRIAVRGRRGTTIRLRHAEMLEGKGLHTANLRSATPVDYYTLKGDGLEVFEPRFTFHGFRHVEVNWKGSFDDVVIERLEGIVLYSDMPSVGHFACSNPMLNQLQSNIVWGQKGNFLEVPTDCPQRDERLGWTGDAEVFVRTACFNRDVQAFFDKWIRDLRDAQSESGAIPTVVPALEPCTRDAGPAWSDAQIICPWTIYRCYGDPEVLVTHYESMQRYLDQLLEDNSIDLIRCHPDLNRWQGFGDWLALDGSGKVPGRTLKDLIGTAYMAHDARLMNEIAVILEKPEDAARYQELFERIRTAFQQRFVTPAGYVAGQTQTGYLLALAFDLLPEDLRQPAATELARMITNNGNHLATGFVGTPHLCPVLAENGHLDLAYTLLENETFPSWIFSIKNGATTIWERWDSWTPDKGFHPAGMNSFNHYAYGAIGAWMAGTVAGLEAQFDDAGLLEVIFRPRPGGSLTWAEATLETPHGKAAIRWDRDESGGLNVQIRVPSNVSARLEGPEDYETPETTELKPGQTIVRLAKR